MPLEAANWPLICSRLQCETSCRHLATDTWHQFLHCWDAILIALVEGDVYHLSLTGHVYIKTGIKFLSSECLPYFWKHLCTKCRFWVFTK